MADKIKSDEEPKLRAVCGKASWNIYFVDTPAGRKQPLRVASINTAIRDQDGFARRLAYRFNVHDALIAELRHLAALPDTASPEYVRNHAAAALAKAAA